MTKNESKELAQKIKIFMLKNGISQRELAKKLDLTPAAISKFLTGNNTLRMDTLNKISKALGTNVNYFFASSGEIKGNNNTVTQNLSTNPQKCLEDEINLIKKELEVHRYQLENLALKIAKFNKK